VVETPEMRGPLPNLNCATIFRVALDRLHVVGYAAGLKSDALGIRSILSAVVRTQTAHSPLPNIGYPHAGQIANDPPSREILPATPVPSARWQVCTPSSGFQAAGAPQSTTNRRDGSAGSTAQVSGSPTASDGTYWTGTGWTARAEIGARLGK
jgi:hypothetical protein